MGILSRLVLTFLLAGILIVLVSIGSHMQVVTEQEANITLAVCALAGVAFVALGAEDK